MAEWTNISEAIESGAPLGADRLLPLVYDELRRLAKAQMASEKPGHTLDATALVHEAYLRLTASLPRLQEERASFANRRHFFVAAAEAMRRILVESARRKSSRKRGGEMARQPLDDDIACQRPAEELLEVHEALAQLEAANSRAAELVKLRYFAGFTLEEAARELGISPRSADSVWSYARAWLLVHLGSVRQT